MRRLRIRYSPISLIIRLITIGAVLYMLWVLRSR